MISGTYYRYFTILGDSMIKDWYCVTLDNACYVYMYTGSQFKIFKYTYTLP